MAARSTGVVRGDTIKLDKPVDQLDGKRVRVVLEPVEQEEDVVLTTEQQTEMWRHWVAHGPQGPIEDEGESDFP